MELDQIIQMLKGKTEIKLVKFISDKGPNSCEDCLKHHGEVFQLDDPEKPELPIHPNCRCKYVEVTSDVANYAAVSSQIGEIFSAPPVLRPDTQFNHVTVRVLTPQDDTYGKFTMKRQFWDFSQLGQLSCTSIDDLLTCLEKKYPNGNITSLLLIGHGGDDAGFFIGNDNLRSIDKTQIKRFKKLLAPYAILELRMCSTVRGEFGKRAAEKLARTLNVIVIAYENPVNALGLPAFVSDEWNTQKNTIEKRYWQPVNKRIFYPR